MEDRFLVRGKDENGEWIIGTLIHPESTISRMYQYPCIFFVKDNKRFHDKILPNTLCQCTGLKDKNGKLIFEGDVVRAMPMAPGSEIEDVNEFIGKVKFDCGSYIIENLFLDDSILLFSEIDTREVVGNIYDNPELLVVG